MSWRAVFQKPQAPPPTTTYPPLQAAVDLVTRMAPIEIDAQEHEIEFDPRTAELIDKCIAYIESQIPRA